MAKIIKMKKMSELRRNLRNLVCGLGTGVGLVTIGVGAYIIATYTDQRHFYVSVVLVLVGMILIFLCRLGFVSNHDDADKLHHLQSARVPMPPTPPPLSKAEIAEMNFKKLVYAWNEVEIYDLSDEYLRRYYNLMQDGAVDAQREMYRRGIKN